MYFTRTFAIALLSAVLALNTLAAPQPEQGEDAIKKVFSQYRTALLDGNGSAAADVVSDRTITYYGTVLTQALTLPREKLADLDFITKLMVLRIRQEFRRAQIEDLTGRKLLMLGVDKGWISKSSVTTVELAKIDVRGDEASATMAAYPDIPAFHFQKESGQWKLDLVASFKLANDAMLHQVKESGLSEEQFILRILSMLSPDKVDEGILSGPRQ